MKSRIFSSLSSLGIMASVLLLFGCSSSNTTYIGKRNWVAKMSKSSLTTGEISYITNQFLVSNGLEEEFKNNPDKVITLLAEEIEKPAGRFLTPNDNIRDVLGVLLDLCMYQALHTDKNIAIKYWLSCSYYSYRFMFDKTITPEPLPNYTLGTAAALRYYNISTAEVFSYIKDKDNKTSFYSKPELSTILNKVQFSVPKSDLLWKTDTFKEFVISYDYLPNKFKSHAFTPGIGVPIIGINDVNKRTNLADREMLINITYPFTFLINYQLNMPKGIDIARSYMAKLSPDNKINSRKMDRAKYIKTNVITATPKIFDSFNDEYTKIGGMKIPLAKDFTMVLAELMNTEKRIDGIKFMFNPGKMGDLKGLYLLAPYDPNRIPLVLIHGLSSEPRTWTPMLNTLLNNRTMRQNYQFWIYSYPTGMPIYASANNFRKSLTETWKKYDPKNDNKKFSKMVIIGHSMGGIITRLSIQSSGGRNLAKNMFSAITKKKLDELNLTDKEKETIDDYLVFESLPFVKRAIMISAPHRGSDMALTLYSKIGIYLTSLPKKLLNKTGSLVEKIIEKKDDSLHKEALVYSKMTTGIGALSPKNVFLTRSNDLDFNKNVKIHSIMGNNEKAGQSGGTDGVVPYWSSHLDNAETEYIVKSDHSAHRNQLAIKEVVRILIAFLLGDLNYQVHFKPLT